jgi:hypothetical protein
MEPLFMEKKPETIDKHREVINGSSTEPNDRRMPKDYFVEYISQVLSHLPRWALILLGGIGTLLSLWFSLGSPGIQQIRSATEIILEPIPIAQPDEFTIAVTRIKNDKNGNAVSRLVADLQTLDNPNMKVGTLFIPRTLELMSSRPDEQKDKSKAQARSYLSESGADVIVWGQMLSANEARLNWTTSKEHFEGTYTKFNDGEIPSKFIPELSILIKQTVWEEINNRKVLYRTISPFAPERLGIRNSHSLSDLTDSSVQVSLYRIDRDYVNPDVITSGLGFKGSSYQAFFDYTNHRIEDFDSLDMFIGIGIRINVNFIVKANSVLVKSLSELGEAAEAGDIEGYITLQTIGISSKSIAGLIPSPNEINTESIQTIIQSISEIKSSINDAEVTPRVFAVSGLSNQTDVYQKLSKMLTLPPQENCLCQ